MIDIFENDKIYGNSYEDVEAPRPFNEAELSKLNTRMPGRVFMGKFSLACKLYALGSTTAFYCKSLDIRSVAVDGQMFDITKVLVAKLKKPDSAEVLVKIIIPREALL